MDIRLPIRHPPTSNMGTRLGEAGLELDWICRVLGNTRAVADKYAKVAPESASKRVLKVLKGGK